MCKYSFTEILPETVTSGVGSHRGGRVEARNDLPDQQSGVERVGGIAPFYGARRDIEVFFKEIKQTIQLADFLGNHADAVRWQI